MRSLEMNHARQMYVDKSGRDQGIEAVKRAAAEAGVDEAV